MAVPALAAVAACSDSFPPVPGPLDRFYFPVGLAVRRLPASNTALLVVSSNFDLRYDTDVGGAVVAVDPDASGNALTGDPSLVVLGGLNIGSFGGEVDYLAGSGADWPYDLPGHACPPLAGLLSPGAAKVVVTSRGAQSLYPIDMDSLGGLHCDGCAVAARPEAFDPYGVTAVCAQTAGVQTARFFVTHLRTAGSETLITAVDLLTGQVQTLAAGFGPAYNPTFDPIRSRLFVSPQLAPIDQQLLKWFSAVAPENLDVVLGSHNVAADVKGAMPRDLAISTRYDPTTGDIISRTGYLRLEMFDYDLAAQTGSFVPTGGSLAVYDLAETSFGVPAMRLLRVVPTCIGTGQIRLFPPRSGQGDLLAITCDAEGVLLFYDDGVGAVVARIGLDPVTGQPLLGRRPFGLALEERDAGKCTQAWNDVHGPVACTRLYVGAFDSSWVGLVELDPTDPAGWLIGKRLGRGRN